MFDTASKQSDIFQPFAQSLLNCFSGYNLTIMTYGQTSSGKTYTMFGSDWESLQQKRSSKIQQHTFYEAISIDENFAGIIPRTIHYVFEQIKKESIKFRVQVSFIQIYNEKIYDLFQSQGPPVALAIHEHKQDGTYIEGLLVPFHN